MAEEKHEIIKEAKEEIGELTGVSRKEIEQAKERLNEIG